MIRANRPGKLAAAYIRIVQTNVFEPVGAFGVDAKPPANGPQASGYAFSYQFPGITSGYDWGDDSLGVGAAGWYLAIDDIANVLYSLNKNDGRILTPAQLQDMQATPLGWDTILDGTGYRWVEKNGGWGANGTTISTSIALFGPGVFAALFVNSDISDSSGPGVQNNWQWCRKCQGLAQVGSASAGNCAGGGLHDHTGSASYLVAMQGNGIVGQDNWRWCNKCQILAFAGGSNLGSCPAGGLHNHTGSNDYVLTTKSNLPLPQESQNNWRWCNKCQILAFGGGAGAGNCAAGGQHDHTGSSNYVLDYVVGADTVLHDAYMDALKP